MSLQVRIGINGETIQYVTIANQGPPGGRFLDGDHPGGGGVRRYVWNNDSGGGVVEHARDDGALALVVKVLEQIMAADST